MNYGRRFGNSRESGAALITALVFLIIITFLALAAMRTSSQELRMALNAEHKIQALQRAQALSDAAITDPSSTAVVGVLGRRVCTGLPPLGEPPCTVGATLNLPAGLLADVGIDAGDGHFVAVERVAPELGPCPRGSGFSAAEVNCATFRLHANYDGAANRRGRADLYEGILVLVPAQ